MPTLADLLDAKNPSKSGQAMGTRFVDIIGEMAHNAGQKLKASRQLIQESAKEFPKYGPKTQEMANSLAEGYSPVGMFVPAELKLAYKASQLEKKGVDPKEIWNQLGLFRGPADKQWRQEISDKSAFLKGGPDFESVVMNRMKALGKDVTQEPMRVGDIMYHPELFAKHPELKDVEVQFLPKNHPAYGRMALEENGENILQIKPNLSSKDANSVALHELQHEIQDKSGFAVGGSSADFTHQDQALKSKNILQWRKEVEEQANRMGLSPLKNADWYSNAEQALIDKYHEWKAPDWLPHEDIRTLASSPAYSKGTDARTHAEQLSKLYGLDTKTTPDTAKQMYTRLGGEAEARQVQSRQSLTDQERQQYYPAEDRDLLKNPYGYDVPISNLLYLDNKGYAR